MVVYLPCHARLDTLAIARMLSHRGRTSFLPLIIPPSAPSREMAQGVLTRLVGSIRLEQGARFYKKEKQEMYVLFGLLRLLLSAVVLFGLSGLNVARAASRYRQARRDEAGFAQARDDFKQAIAVTQVVVTLAVFMIPTVAWALS